MRRLSSAFIPPGPNRHADTRVDSRTSRQTCSTGVRDSSSPELVVVTRCSGNKFSRCQATESMIGCRRVSGSSINSSGRASRSRRTVPFACRRVANSPSRITRWLRPPGLSDHPVDNIQITPTALFHHGSAAASGDAASERCFARQSNAQAVAPWPIAPDGSDRPINFADG